LLSLKHESYLLLITEQRNKTTMTESRRDDSKQSVGRKRNATELRS